MQKATSYKSKQFFALVAKLFIVIACGYFMYDKIFANQQQSFSDFALIVTDNDVLSYKNILFLFLFSFLNWFFEIKKWQLLANQVQNSSFFEASKQSLASLTASLITPNRIGEYGAKALYYKKSLRKKIVALNLVGNFSQLLITVIFGLIGCTFLYFKYSIDIETTKLIYILIFFLLLFLALWFIKKKKITYKGHSIKHLKKYIVGFSIKFNQKIISFSLIRYLLFSHQFYYLFLIFNVEISYLNAIMGVFSMYFIASIIPMLSLFDVIIKGSVAIIIFSLFQIDDTIILAIVLVMWLFNFVIPSIVGSYFVLTFNSNTLIQSKE